jgi:mxaJ protein
MRALAAVVALPALLLLAPATAPAQLARGTLRVCADPNNLPYSNQRREGFENKLAELIAADLHVRVAYTWWAQRRGYVRNTLRAGKCDVLMGVPTGFDPVIITRPYYRSTYTFVTRRPTPPIASFDDPALRRLRVGVQIVGDGEGSSPPVAALTRRGIVENVTGYSILGDYREPNPPSRIVRAVANGEIDVGIVWGPLAGYFAKQSSVPLRVDPVSPEIDLPYLPFVFDMAIGVRRGEGAFRDRLDDVLRRRRRDIDRLLASYGVPRADTPAVASTGTR